MASVEKCKELEPGRGVQGKRARMLLRVSSEQQLDGWRPEGAEADCLGIYKEPPGLGSG